MIGCAAGRVCQSGVLQCCDDRRNTVAQAQPLVWSANKISDGDEGTYFAVVDLLHEVFH